MGLFAGIARSYRVWGSGEVREGEVQAGSEGMGVRRGQRGWGSGEVRGDGVQAGLEGVGIRRGQPPLRGAGAGVDQAGAWSAGETMLVFMPRERPELR